ncbi:MAG TPA: tyrosine--tRNA ligase [Candidatus Paceibacterota bacterium]
MKLFKGTGAVSTDVKDIDSFLSRGVENVFPSREAFAKALSSGRRLSIYLGVDPTGPTLHMGHAIPLMKLAALQKMGHHVILLMGDFTAMIGDPTDKGAARKRLTRKEVLENLKSYKEQAATFLSFKGANAAEIRFNSKWLSKMSFADVVELASHTTVQQMLERDMFEKRMAEKKPIYLHEFLYPLMQGYDSVAMGVDVEIGGNDQTFNMLAGRDLARSINNKEKFVVAAKLLADPSGKKMGKTEGNMITLADNAKDMFGKVMSWPDGMIVPGFELCTRVSDEEIEKEKAYLASGANPRDAKARLAFAVAELYHGKEQAKQAKASFFSAFSAGTIPADAPEAKVAKGAALADVLVEHKIVASKTEFRRLVGEKAVKDIQTGKAIETHDFKIERDVDLKIGKMRFIKIRV